MRRWLGIIVLFNAFLFSHFAYADSAFSNRPDVQAFIQYMVKKHHFNQQQLVTLFNSVKIRPQIMNQMKKPLEHKPWYTYQMLFVSEWRIKEGVAFWNKYADALERAEHLYGVPASIIVATIGVETKYGQRIGEYRVLDSLSNIGFSDSPRAKFFRSELEQFLLLTREQHLNPLSVMGSYAGAIGQPQFMPSSYRNYAVNFSRSGKIDLMHNEVDVIGSIANYYSKFGWKLNEPVAIQARVIGDRYAYLSRKVLLDKQLSVTELSRYGVVPIHKVLQDDLKVKVIELESRYSTEYWLGFHNFTVIKRYNPSDLYAMAVYQLSAYIRALKEQDKNG
jgi:membrane-bound lytic murein transglycosylase B